MSSKVIVMGIVIVMTTSLIVFTMEFFLPLSKKSDMNICCRNVLLKMEEEGGLALQERTNLYNVLVNQGFTNITISASEYGRHGETLNLEVTAEYPYSKLTELFGRTNLTQCMRYSMSSMSRRVDN